VALTSGSQRGHQSRLIIAARGMVIATAASGHSYSDQTRSPRISHFVPFMTTSPEYRSSHGGLRLPVLGYAWHTTAEIPTERPGRLVTASRDHVGAASPSGKTGRDYFERASDPRATTAVGVLPRGRAEVNRPAASQSNPLVERPGAVRTKLATVHPAVSLVAVMLGSYLLLAAALIVAGLAVTHILSHSFVGRWDEHVNDWFAAHRTSTWNRVSAGFTSLANTLEVVVVAAVVTVLLLIRRWGRSALLLVIALAVELAVFLSTTYLVARPRPSAPHLGSTPSTFSWPSGHTAATLVLYGGIALLVKTATRRRLLRVSAWMIAVALTVGVALSRMYRGEHHPTDTLAGAILGVGALWAAVSAIRAGGSARRAPADQAPAHQAPAHQAPADQACTDPANRSPREPPHQAPTNTGPAPANAGPELATPRGTTQLTPELRMVR
jgi:membrane-associated phospholipid phosphatase